MKNFREGTSREGEVVFCDEFPTINTCGVSTNVGGTEIERLSEGGRTNA